MLLVSCPWCRVTLVPSSRAEDSLECRVCDSVFSLGAQDELWERLQFEVSELVSRGVRLQG